MTVVCVDNYTISLQALGQSIVSILPTAATHTFDKADAALSFVKENGCDVLISEIELNGIDGLTLARKIKELNPNVNIIFHTVCDEREHAREVLNIKPSGYLLKPADDAQLAFELNHLRYGA